jgi:holo-[acyl-carrier protein] synthase
MIHIGVDLADIGKVARAIELSGEAFLSTGWTSQERKDCAGRPDRLAWCWATKEAAMKALGAGFGEICPLEVEVHVREGGRPEIVLHGGALVRADQLGIRAWSISVSQDDRIAVACVIGLGGSDG